MGKGVVVGRADKVEFEGFDQFVSNLYRAHE